MSHFRTVAVFRFIFFLGSFFAALSLGGCSTFFDKDNTPPPKPLAPLPAHAPPVTLLWHTQAGSGQQNRFLRLVPVLIQDSIAVTDSSGVITRVNRHTGRIEWQQPAGEAISAGLSAGNGQIYAGTDQGTLLALSDRTGQLRWKAHAVSGIAAPAAVGNRDIIVKSVDGHLTAFSAVNGQQRWTRQETPPGFILQASSMPRISGNSVYAGFANGMLGRFDLAQGNPVWEQTIALPAGSAPMQGMVDIAADPLVTARHVYAAAWQGNLAALSVRTGTVRWRQPFSTQNAMAHDGRWLYLADAQGHVHAFDAQTGEQRWEQTALEARGLTAPVLSGRYVIMGDAQGWVHWLDKNTGKLVTRFRAGGGGLFVPPQVAGNTVYLYTRQGQLIACRLGA